jgi:hypothetical protein
VPVFGPGMKTEWDSAMTTTLLTPCGENRWKPSLTMVAFESSTVSIKDRPTCTKPSICSDERPYGSTIQCFPSDFIFHSASSGHKSTLQVRG